MVADAPIQTESVAVIVDTSKPRRRRKAWSGLEQVGAQFARVARVNVAEGATSPSKPFFSFFLDIKKKTIYVIRKK